MVPASLTTYSGSHLGKLRRRDVQPVADGQNCGNGALSLR